MAIKMDSAQLQRDGRLDAAQSVFFARELEQIDGQMYEVKYAALELFELVPVKTDLHPGTEVYTWRSFDARGVAVMTANYASGSPRADVDGKEESAKVRSIRASYGYNVQEIRAASKEGRPLENMRAVAARRAINEKINRTGLLGDSEHGIVGLFNQPNFQSFTPGTKTGGGTAWTGAGATADEILADMFGIVDQIPTVTNEVEKANTLLLPYARLRLISRKLMGAQAPGVSVLKFFQQERPGIEVRGALFLDTAGSGGVARMVAYNKDPMCMELLLPIAFESFPPQVKGMEYVVENHARMGGVVCRYPLACAYGDGI